MVTDPDSFSQGDGTWFCGFSVLVAQTMIKTDPNGYVKFMISLYSNGEGTYGSESYTPSQAIMDAVGTLNYKAKDGDKDGLPDAGLSGLAEHPANQMLLLTFCNMS